MKNVFYILLFCLFGVSLHSQTFKIGGSIGLPAADAADISTLAIGIDAYYYFTDVDAVVEIGATAGFRNFFGDEIAGFAIEDAQFLPLAGAARIKLFGVLSGGLDVGYALGISDGLDGGLYYRPVVGLDLADTIELTASFEGISDAATWGNFNVGVLLEF
jgi:hypothetical protein